MDAFWEKLAKKREIRDKINKLEKEIRTVENIKTLMESIKNQMSKEQEQWELKHGEYMGLELAPYIKVIDSFEGVAAEQLALDFPQTVTDIENISAQITEILTGIADQILKIDDYIAELQIQVDALYAELDAL